MEFISGMPYDLTLTELQFCDNEKWEDLEKVYFPIAASNVQDPNEWPFNV